MGGVARLFMMAHWMMFDLPTRRDKESCSIWSLSFCTVATITKAVAGSLPFVLSSSESFYKDEEM
jgi:hypothetical protein